MVLPRHTCSKTPVAGWRVLLPILLKASLSSCEHAQQHRAATSLPSEDGDDRRSCSLYFAESSVQPGRYGLYAARNGSVGEPVAEPELFWPVLDANKNEWSPWHDVSWPGDAFPRVLGESVFLSEVLFSGAGAMLACSNKYANVAADGGETLESVGVHRSSDASAGSFTYYGNSTYRLSRPVQAGEELVLPCPEDLKSSGRKVLDLAFLRDTALCLHELHVRPSTIPGAGRGAFAARAVREGRVIAASPVLHLDRSQTDFVHQEDYPSDHYTPFRRDHDILYNNSCVLGKQVLLNYCYGHPASNVLLLPYAPAVNFVNHGGRILANAKIRWSADPRFAASSLKALRPLPLLSTPAEAEGLLVVEYVATRDITPGEEILLDYGDAWEAAWNRHVEAWHPEPSSVSYQSAVDYLREHPDEPFRTAVEQKARPYPPNVQTACYFTPPPDYDEEAALEWFDDDGGLRCLRPCEVRERFANEDGEDSLDEEEDQEAGGPFYTVVAYNSDHSRRPSSCGDLPWDGLEVTDVPHRAITLIDVPYTGDLHLPWGFRHELGLPDTGFVPEAWRAVDPEPEGDFAGGPLRPGELSRISWRDTGEPATPWGFRVGLPPQLRHVLLEYCRRKGILQALRHVTVEGNGFLPGQESKLNLDGQEWFLQRPGKKWSSNLHWLSPNGAPAHDDYLQALSLGGFDEVLRGIGEQLQLDGLVAFHVTFIGVSNAHRGYLHTDVSQTQGKAYNVIIPLLLANDTGPELDLAEGVDRSGRIGRYKYEYDVAAMMGDECSHATSAVDYRHSREMRLAATVYIADVNEANAERITEEYTQAYPPRGADLLLSWAGRHWKPGDPSRKLPEPSLDHVLLRLSSADGGPPKNGTSSSLVKEGLGEAPASEGALVAATTTTRTSEREVAAASLKGEL